LILIFLALLFIFIVVPVSLILQRAVPVTVYILMFIVFGLAHMFLFNIYRSLVDESESSTKNK
jgi:lipopolysaccharide export LptBFGC system permease protein LptF